MDISVHPSNEGQDGLNRKVANIKNQDRVNNRQIFNNENRADLCPAKYKVTRRLNKSKSESEYLQWRQ